MLIRKEGVVGFWGLVLLVAGLFGWVYFSFPKLLKDVLIMFLKHLVTE